MFDSHFNVGQFHQRYFSPRYILQSIDKLQLDGVAVTSTTICMDCKEAYDLACEEMQYLTGRHQSVFPILLITPKMFQSGELGNMLSCGVSWKCFKFHFYLNRQWYDDKALFRSAMEYLQGYDLPVMFHTGGDCCSYAGVFEDICSKYGDKTFILAHGRPIEETLRVMQRCSNVYCDTAFMPEGDLKLLAENNLTQRILWGSDYPVQKHFYPTTKDKYYYRKILSAAKNVLGENDFKLITEANRKQIFK